MPIHAGYSRIVYRCGAVGSRALEGSLSMQLECLELDSSQL